MSTINLTVGASSDDAYQRRDGTSYDHTNTVLFSFSSTTNPGDIGFRFTSVTIPKEAAIDAATMDVNVWGTARDDVDAFIYADDVDNSVTFDSGSNDIQNRTLTTASTEWQQDAVGAGWQTTPDLSSVIQEIVNRSGWSSGNALTIIWKGETDTAKSFWVYSYDQGTYYPKLDIDYTPKIVKVVDETEGITEGKVAFRARTRIEDETEAITETIVAHRGRSVIPPIGINNWVVRQDAAGFVCGPGTKGGLRLNEGIVEQSIALDATGDSWGVEVNSTVIPAGNWQFDCEILAGGIFGIVIIDVKVRIVDSDCNIKQTIIDDSIDAVQGSQAKYSTDPVNPGAVSLADGDQLMLVLTKISSESATFFYETIDTTSFDTPNLQIPQHHSHVGIPETTPKFRARSRIENETEAITETVPKARALVRIVNETTAITEFNFPNNHFQVVIDETVSIEPPSAELEVVSIAFDLAASQNLYELSQYVADVSPFTDFNFLYVKDAPGQLHTFGIAGIGNTKTGGWISPPIIPNSDQWRDSGSWNVKIVLAFATTSVRVRIRGHRLNSAGTSIQNTDWSGWADFDVNPAQVLSVVSPIWEDEEACDNRIGIEVQFKNMDQDLLTVKHWTGVVSYIATDITENAGSCAEVIGTIVQNPEAITENIVHPLGLTHITNETAAIIESKSVYRDLVRVVDETTAIVEAVPHVKARSVGETEEISETTVSEVRRVRTWIFDDENSDITPFNFNKVLTDGSPPIGSLSIFLAADQKKSVGFFLNKFLPNNSDWEAGYTSIVTLSPTVINPDFTARARLVRANKDGVIQESGNWSITQVLAGFTVLVPTAPVWGVTLCSDRFGFEIEFHNTDIEDSVTIGLGFGSGSAASFDIQFNSGVCGTLSQIENETQGITEEINTFQTQFDAVSETVEITETTARAKGIAFVVNESVAITETRVKALAVVRVCNETEAILESKLAYRDRVLVENETESILDAKRFTRTFSTIENETEAITETTYSVVRSDVVSIESETEEIPETISYSRAVARIRNEFVTVSEGTSYRISTFDVVDETEAITENVVRSRARVRMEDETEEITENTVSHITGFNIGYYYDMLISSRRNN